MFGLEILMLDAISPTSIYCFFVLYLIPAIKWSLLQLLNTLIHNKKKKKIKVFWFSF